MDALRLRREPYGSFVEKRSKECSGGRGCDNLGFSSDLDVVLRDQV